MHTKSTLILGGARSGKSRFGERLALSLGFEPVYIATAQALDQEMTDRISHHRKYRTDKWLTVEEPLALATAIQQYSTENRIILADCLTLWLSNLYEHGKNISHAEKELFEALGQAAGPVILIANEVGNGIVPADPRTRDYRDQAGLLNQQIAAIVHQVFFIIAGLPIPLKKNGSPLL